MQQLVELERLGDEVGGALLDRVDRVLHRAEAGDDDRDDVRVALERGVEHRAAVDARQPEVRDDDVEGELGEPRQRLFAVRGLLDDEAVVGQPLGDGLPQRRLVVDEQQMFRVFSHLVVRRYFDTRRRVNVARRTAARRFRSTPTSCGEPCEAHAEPRDSVR